MGRNHCREGERSRQETRGRKERRRKNLLNQRKILSEKVEKEETAIVDEQFSGYNLIEVDGGDLSGNREPDVVVEIGFGDREYWAFKNSIIRLEEYSD